MHLVDYINFTKHEKPVSHLLYSVYFIDVALQTRNFELFILKPLILYDMLAFCKYCIKTVFDLHDALQMYWCYRLERKQSVMTKNVYREERGHRRITAFHDGTSK